jgi:hypothetical protein
MMSSEHVLEHGKNRRGSTWRSAAGNDFVIVGQPVGDGYSLKCVSVATIKAGGAQV